jgi:hypothetical protein
MMTQNLKFKFENKILIPVLWIQDGGENVKIYFRLVNNNQLLKGADVLKVFEKCMTGHPKWTLCIDVVIRSECFIFRDTTLFLPHS